jgi:hypothetical protein
MSSKAITESIWKHLFNLLHYQYCVSPVLTAKHNGVDGDLVVFVLFVWIRTPQPEACEDGAEKVGQDDYNG